MTGVRDLVRRPRAVPEAGERFSQLYETEAPRLLRYFRRHTHDCHTAPDLVQDAFARLAATERATPLVNPAAYLQRIARNLLIDRARSRALRDTWHVALDEEQGSVPASQEDALLASELLTLYEKAIAELPERTRMIFVLQRADGLTYRAIAQRLGLPLWTVEHHMKRAIAHVDRTLDRR